MKSPNRDPMRIKERKAETKPLASHKVQPGLSSFLLFSPTRPAAFLPNFLLSI